MPKPEFFGHFLNQFFWGKKIPTCGWKVTIFNSHNSHDIGTVTLPFSVGLLKQSSTGDLAGTHFRHLNEELFKKKYVGNERFCW